MLQLEINSTPMHWTYEEIREEENDLFQGDILSLTDELRDLLTNVHNHFTDPKYLGFIISTQSCDLVLRKNKCKATHINLSVIKSLEDTLEYLIDQYCQKVCKGVYIKEDKQEAKKLLERILNQNEEKLGLFYLHPDPIVKIGEPSIAILRVSISLRNEHYQVLKNARSGAGRLKSEFRNKLGWLIGNLYSRAATTDWTESEQKVGQMKALADGLLGNVVSHWPSQAVVNNAKKHKEELDGIGPDEMVKILKKHEPPLFKDGIAKVARQVLEELIVDIEPAIANKFENRLKQDPTLTSTIKYYQKLMSMSPEEFEELL